MGRVPLDPLHVEHALACSSSHQGRPYYNQIRIILHSSAVVTHRSRKSNCPASLTSQAASSSPLIAARYSEVAMLMRLTPASASSPTENDFPLIPAMKLTGFDTAAQTARTAARSGSPGAKSTSAPAFSNA